MGKEDGRVAQLPLHHQGAREANSVYWYRIPAAQFSHLLNPALLVTRAGTNFQVYLDDEWAFGGGFDVSPMRYTWNTPFLIPLSKQTLAHSKYIRIAVYALAGNHMILEPLKIGEYEDLTDSHQSFTLLQNDLSYAISVGALCLAMVSFLLLLSSRGEKQYLYGVLTAVALICSNFNFFVSHPPVEQKLWQALAHASLDWFCVFSVQWMATLKQIEHRLIQRLWIWGLLSTAINLILPLNYIVPTVEILHLGSIGLFLFALALPHRSEISDSLEKRLIALTGILGSALCLFDLLIQFRVFYIAGLPRAVPLMFFMLLLFNHIILLRRFLQTYNNARRSKEVLEAIVQVKEKEMNEQFAQMARLQTKQARTAEREEIFREIHDGMGGHLVSAMALTQKQSPNDAVLAALRSAHDDMRLLIDGGTLEDVDLAETLGQLRHRLQPQISAAGLKLTWKMQATAEMPVLGIQQRMHVVRIIQECVTNAIKHANATTLTISYGSSEGCLEIAVIDNGQGGLQSSQPTRKGNGLSNMHYRAEQLGGKFSLRSDQSGCVALLTLPISKTESGQSAVA